MSLIRRLDARDPGFDAALMALLDRMPERDGELQRTVAGILADVRARGDAAVLEYTRRFDGLDAAGPGAPMLPRERLEQAWNGLAPALREALQVAHDRIRAHAQLQGLQGFEHHDAHGTRMGVRITPLDRAGLYVPGGKAAYPSSVLMNAVPAKVAGVAEVVMCVPTPKGVVNEAVLGAAWLAGVDRVFTIGGAQAVAAMAFGTASVPAVDKIVGPGNAWVAEAKRQVFGRVGIDSVAGPSEICIICDGLTEVEWIVMDLFSQAEHDEEAQSLLISDDAAFLDAVEAEIERRLPGMAREAILRASLAQRGALIRVASLEQAADVANVVAAEHLELSVAEPEALLARIRHAGAVFLGRNTPEAMGDYCAGPNHVLPTSRAARYASPLGTYEFQKRTSLIACTAEGARALAPVAGTLADAEGLDAHARSARLRG
jgi:histidinol dehydrogenase